MRKNDFWRWVLFIIKSLIIINIALTLLIIVTLKWYVWSLSLSLNLKIISFLIGSILLMALIIVIQSLKLSLVIKKVPDYFYSNYLVAAFSTGVFFIILILIPHIYPNYKAIFFNWNIIVLILPVYTLLYTSFSYPFQNKFFNIFIPLQTTSVTQEIVSKLILFFSTLSAALLSVFFSGMIFHLFFL